MGNFIPQRPEFGVRVSSIAPFPGESEEDVALRPVRDRVLAVLAQVHTIEYCPSLPCIVRVASRGMSEPDVFAVGERLCTGEADARKLALSGTEAEGHVRAMWSLLMSRNPGLGTHLRSFGGLGNLVFWDWVVGCFAGWVPPEAEARVQDVFLSEGRKVLLRLGLAWLRARKRQIKAAETAGEVLEAIRGWVCPGLDVPESVRAIRRTHVTEKEAGTRKLAVASESMLDGGESPNASFDVERWLRAGFAVRGLRGEWVEDKVDEGHKEAVKASKSSGWSFASFFGGASATAKPEERGGLVLLGDDEDSKTKRPPAAHGGGGGSSAAAAVGEGSDGKDRWWAPKIVGIRPQVLPLPKVEGMSDIGARYSFSTVTTPALATLANAVPPLLRKFDWRCVYSTARNGWTLAELHRRTRGLAPIILCLVVRRDDVTATLAVVAVAGLSPPRFGSTRIGWSGQDGDTLVRLDPEPVICPPESSHMFILSTDEFLAFGGSSSHSKVLLRLGSSLERCSVGSLLLQGVEGSEEDVQLVGLEAFAFVNRTGRLQQTSARGADLALGRAAQATMELVEKEDARERQDTGTYLQARAKQLAASLAVAEAAQRDGAPPDTDPAELRAELSQVNKSLHAIQHGDPLGRRLV